MRKTHHALAIAALATLTAIAPLPVAAGSDSGDIISYTVDQPIEDVLFALENEIIDRGLVIDNVSKVGTMLDRTAADVGATTKIFSEAKVYSFCSATLSRKVMEVNPMNVAYCPYTIFAFATPDSPDRTTVGFNDYPENEMQEVEDFLNDIVRTALELE